MIREAMTVQVIVDANSMISIRLILLQLKLSRAENNMNFQQPFAAFQ